MNIPPELDRKAEEIIFRYPNEHRESALVPLMAEAQKLFGAITPDVETWLAKMCGVSLVKVREVLTFYSMMRAQPVGKFLIQYCQNIACCLMGGEEIQKHIEDKLGIRPGETTKDGMFNLRCVECLGGCAWGPMMLVNEDQYFQLSVERVDHILDGFRNGNPVPPDQPTPLLGNVAEGAKA
jgi:NADH-quinone oxidoreductase E subunit